MLTSPALRRLVILAIIGGGLWYGWDRIAPVAAGLFNFVSSKGTEVAGQMYDDVTKERLTKEQREALERTRLAEMARNARAERERREAEEKRAAYQKWLDDLAAYAAEHGGAMVSVDINDGVAKVPPGMLEVTAPPEDWVIGGGELEFGDEKTRFGEDYLKSGPTRRRGIQLAAKRFDLADAYVELRNEGSRLTLALGGRSWEARNLEDPTIRELEVELRECREDLKTLKNRSLEYGRKKFPLARMHRRLKLEFANPKGRPDMKQAIYRHKPHLFRRDMNAYKRGTRQWQQMVLERTIAGGEVLVKDLEAQIAERRRAQEAKMAGVDREALKPFRQAAKRLTVAIYLPKAAEPVAESSDAQDDSTENQAAETAPAEQPAAETASAENAASKE